MALLFASEDLRSENEVAFVAATQAKSAQEWVLKAADVVASER